MIVENCLWCGGTHIGCYECPFDQAALKRMKKNRLTPEMARAAAFAIGQGGKIYRHAGGFWGCEQFIDMRSPWISTPTVQALVRRGVATYTRWKEGRASRFPIEITLAKMQETKP